MYAFSENINYIWLNVTSITLCHIFTPPSLPVLFCSEWKYCKFNPIFHTFHYPQFLYIRWWCMWHRYMFGYVYESVMYPIHLYKCICPLEYPTYTYTCKNANAPHHCLAVPFINPEYHGLQYQLTCWLNASCTFCH